MSEQDVGLKVALAAYLDAGRPRVCPCCGGWQGPTLPMCTDEGWAHHESCGRTRYSPDLCVACEEDLHALVAPTGHDGETGEAG